VADRASGGNRGEDNVAKRRIVDAHHHLWQVSRGNNYPWLQNTPRSPGVAGDLTAIARDYLADEFVADTANYDLVRSVHVEAIPADPVEEARWVQGIADQRGFPHGIVARAELHLPTVEATLAALRQFRNLRAIRHILNWHPRADATFVDRTDLMSDPAWLRGYGLLKKYDLTFDLQLYPSQMAEAARVAARHPDTLVILNHAGMPIDRDENGLRQWREGMKLLAAVDNVAVEISGLGMVDWHWTADSIRPFVLQTIETFGVDRSMFASNFPVDKLYTSFDELYGAFERIVADFSEAEKEKMFCDNAIKFYRL
jgi:predicted TIM-barrel fold metal-dependent hydrolase